MKIGVLGTGMVGKALGSALVERGHEVYMGSRSESHEGARRWAESTGHGAHQGTFAEAAAFADEVVINCTAGNGSLEALGSIPAADLEGKLLVDVSNPLDFSQGPPPTLFTSGRESLGERIQSSLPHTRVVKALNTLTADIMVDPVRVTGGHHLFICGDDPDARARVTELLGQWFGWSAARILDLGGMEAARGTEAYVLFWFQVMQALESPYFNIELHRGG